MNWLKPVLSIIPLKGIALYLLEYLKVLALKTDTKVDDKAVELVKTLLTSAEITGDGVKLPTWVMEFIKKFTLKEIIDVIVEELRARAAATQYEFDDKLVEVFVAILETAGIYNDEE